MGRKKLEDTPERQAEKKRKAYEYYLLHRDELRERSKLTYHKDPESAKQKTKQWMQNNKKRYYSYVAGWWSSKIKNMTVEEHAEYRKKANEYQQEYRRKRKLIIESGTGNYPHKTPRRNPARFSHILKDTENKYPNYYSQNREKFVQETINKYAELKKMQVK